MYAMTMAIGVLFKVKRGGEWVGRVCIGECKRGIRIDGMSMVDCEGSGVEDADSGPLGSCNTCTLSLDLTVHQTHVQTQTRESKRGGFYQSITFPAHRWLDRVVVEV